jgi:hypothetical protein
MLAGHPGKTLCVRDESKVGPRIVETAASLLFRKGTAAGR